MNRYLLAAATLFAALPAAHAADTCFTPQSSYSPATIGTQVLIVKERGSGCTSLGALHADIRTGVMTFVPSTPCSLAGKDVIARMPLLQFQIPESHPQDGAGSLFSIHSSSPMPVMLPTACVAMLPAPPPEAHP